MGIIEVLFLLVFNISNEMWWAVHMCLLQIPSGMFLPKINKIG